MKRPWLHILFWVIYIIQDALLHFTWMAPAMKTVPVGEQVMMAIGTSFVLLPPKLIAVYYFIFFGLRKIVDEKRIRFNAILEILLLLIFTLILFRVIFHYLVIPEIYSLKPGGILFDPKNTLIAVLDMGYITGVAIALKLMRLQASAKEREKNLVREKLETELKFLKNQTNPHFLFNTLNSIYALSRKKSDQAPEVVMKLSELLGFMLYESGKETITIAEEIKMIEDYLSLEKLRYTERLSIRFQKNVDNELQPIAPLLLLPLIENAFKHGVSETRFETFIDISIALHQGRLEFYIKNPVGNGTKKQMGKSIGLESIKRQLELLYRDHELVANSQGEIFTVQIKINLESYGKI